jgi:hypothetical protein
MRSMRQEPLGDPHSHGTPAEAVWPADRRKTGRYGSPPPGTRFAIGSEDLILLGRTGDGRYAFVPYAEFGSASRPRPRMTIRGRIEAEQAMGVTSSAPRQPDDRRGRWARDR